MTMTARTLLLGFFCAFVILAFIPHAQAIGISPGRVQTNFAPGEQRELTVTLLNNGNAPVDVEMRVAGILDGRVAARNNVRIPARGSTTVPMTFTMPDSLSRPGTHTSYVYFAEKVPDNEAGTFAVRTEVGIAIIIWQPYPGQYAEIVASAPSIPQGEDTKLKLLVNNLGSDAIEDGKATVRVISAEGDLQDVFTFSNLNIAGNSNKDYYDRIPASGYAPGRYTLDAKLVYGVNTSTMKGSFAVGTQDVEPLSIEGPLYLDKPVNRYTVHVESLWNLPLENVYATVQLGSTPSSTSPIRLNAFERGALQGFWETDASVKEGTLLAKVTVFFPGGEHESLLPIQVYNQTPVAPTYEEPSIIELSAADLVFLILVIIAVLLVVLFAARRLRRKDNEGPPPAAKTQQPQTPSTSAAPAMNPPKQPGGR